MKAPVGFALIEWKNGERSEGLISKNESGTLMLHCANWKNAELQPLSKFENDIENIISDIDDISMVLMYEDED